MEKSIGFMCALMCVPLALRFIIVIFLHLLAFSHKDLMHKVNAWFRDVVWPVPMEGYFVTEGNDIRCYFANQSFD